MQYALWPVSVENAVVRLDDESDPSWEIVGDADVGASAITVEVTSFSVYSAARVDGASIDAGPNGEPDGGGTDASTELDAGAADGGAGGDGGAGDAGPVSCDPPPTAPTGSATLTGATFTPLDAVAVVSHRTDVATEGGFDPFRTELRIRLTQHADACGLENGGLRLRDERYFEIRLFETSDTDFPGLPAPGTYDLDRSLPHVPGTVYYKGAGELYDCMSDCMLCTDAVGLGSFSGSVTLTSVTASQVEGSFTYNDPGGTYSGTFSAPICGTTDPSPDYCCYDP